MKMLTTKEISEAWNISERMVRRFCVDGRIPEAKLENGTWMIPAGTAKPKRKPKEKTADPKENLTTFAKRVVYQIKDYNGRVGCLIMMKECLRHGIDPFIIDDKRRGAYNRGIAACNDDHEPLISVSLEAQKRFQGKMELCALFQYARYPEPYRGGKL